MLEPGDAGLFDKQLGELAHVQLSLLTQFGPLSRNQLARQAIQVDGVLSDSISKNGLEMANAALRALHAKGFVNEHHNLFRITPSGQDALERYPDSFSPLFIQRELLSFEESKVTPVTRGWGGLKTKLSRRKR
jgi:hypothetical protein